MKLQTLCQTSNYRLQRTVKRHHVRATAEPERSARYD